MEGEHRYIMVSLEQMLENIETLRQKMIEIVERNGLHNQEAIKISKELDKLLNRYEYEKLFKKRVK